jgi:hypothetical protein
MSFYGLKSQNFLQKCHFRGAFYPNFEPPLNLNCCFLPDLHGVSFEGVDKFGRGHVEDGDDAVDGATGNVLSIRGLELK